MNKRFLPTVLRVNSDNSSSSWSSPSNSLPLDVSEIGELSSVYSQFKQISKKEHYLLLELEKLSQKKTELYHFLQSKKKPIFDLYGSLKKGTVEISSQNELRLLELTAFLDGNKLVSEQLFLDKESKEFVIQANSNLKRLIEPLPNSPFSPFYFTPCRLWISGPEKSGSTQAHFTTKISGPEKNHCTIVAAKSITTFPSSVITPHYHELSMSDYFNVKAFKDRTLMCLTKGSGWGEKSVSASQTANKEFMSVLETRMNAIFDSTSAVVHLIQALYKAHHSISSAESTRCICFGGIMGPVSEKGNVWGFTYINIGNCMAFHYSAATGEWSHFTSRNASKDSDHELMYGIGRLDSVSGADLSRLDIGLIYLEKKDMILVCTDGVYDNLDPEVLGLSSQDCGLKYSWSEAKIICPEECSKVKIRYMIHKLQNMSSPLSTPKTLIDEIFCHCEQTTAPSRAFLMSHKGKKLPSSYIDFPGKLAHCTSICLSPTPRISLGESFSQPSGSTGKRLKVPKALGSQNLQLTKNQWNKLLSFLNDDHEGTKLQSLVRSLPTFPLLDLAVSTKMVAIQGPEDPFAPNDKFTTDIGPSTNLDFRNTVMKYLYGRTITSYPNIPNHPTRDGDPICDYFTCKMFESAILFTVTDGCNWGEQVRRASVTANRAFMNQMKESLKKANTVKELGILLLHSLRKAHCAIYKTAEDPYSTGCTTLLGGLLFKTSSELAETPWGVLVCTVGDCKAFCFSNSSKKFTDITEIARARILNAKDSGGRLGITQNDFGADLRNLSIVFKAMNDSDLIFVCSDGVYDNLDPQLLAKSPRQTGYDKDEWTAENEQELVMMNNAKSKYMCSCLSENFRSLPSNETIPKDFIETLLESCFQTTQSSRDFLIGSMGKKRLPSDYVRFPGKMDHMTGICLQVLSYEQMTRLNYLLSLSLHLETTSDINIQPSSLHNMLYQLTLKPDMKFWSYTLDGYYETILPMQMLDTLWEFFNFHSEDAPEDALYQHRSGVILLLEQWFRKRPQDFVEDLGEKTLQYLEKK